MGFKQPWKPTASSLKMWARHHLLILIRDGPEDKLLSHTIHTACFEKGLGGLSELAITIPIKGVRSIYDSFHFQNPPSNYMK